MRDRGRSRSGSTSAGCARSPLTGHPRRHRRRHRLRGRRAGVRLPELVDGVPGVDHPRQRHQLRDRAHVALRGAPRARRGSRARRSARPCAGVWRGTLVASIAASAAYASLMVTSFRGFYQFGVMGAVGALACWLATFTVLPAMLVLLDRHGREQLSPSRAALRSIPRAAGALRCSGGAAAGAGAVTLLIDRVGSSACATSCRTRSSTTSASSPRRSRPPQQAQAVQPQRRPAVRALALAHHRPRRRRRRGRADQADHPPAGRRAAPGPTSSDRSSTVWDLLPGAARGAGAQAGAHRADPQADARPVARAC